MVRTNLDCGVSCLVDKVRKGTQQVDVDCQQERTGEEKDTRNTFDDHDAAATGRRRRQARLLLVVHRHCKRDVCIRHRARLLTHLNVWTSYRRKAFRQFLKKRKSAVRKSVEESQSLRGLVRITRWGYESASGETQHNSCAS